MIDPDAATPVHVGPQRPGERLVPVGPQGVRDVGRETPVLTIAGEVVGRGADPGIERQQVLVRPGVGTARIDTDREIGDQRRRRDRSL